MITDASLQAQGPKDAGEDVDNSEHPVVAGNLEDDDGSGNDAGPSFKIPDGCLIEEEIFTEIPKRMFEHKYFKMPLSYVRLYYEAVATRAKKDAVLEQIPTAERKLFVMSVLKTAFNIVPPDSKKSDVPTPPIHNSFFGVQRKNGVYVVQPNIDQVLDCPENECVRLSLANVSLIFRLIGRILCQW